MCVCRWYIGDTCEERVDDRNENRGDAVSNNNCASYALVTFLYIGDMLMRFETDACNVNVPIIKLVVRLDRGEDRGEDRGDDRTEEIDQGCSVGVPHVRWW